MILSFLIPHPQLPFLRPYPNQHKPCSRLFQLLFVFLVHKVNLRCIFLCIVLGADFEVFFDLNLLFKLFERTVFVPLPFVLYLVL
jgi:hypothetical protein